MVAGGHVSGTTVDAITITATVLAGVLTGLRIYTRKKIVRNAGVDDGLICIGIILSVLLTVTMCEQVAYGMGRHESDVSAHDGVISLRWFWASVWIYYLALWAVKMSILFQYLRIFLDGGYRRACFVLMGVVTVWTGWAFFSAVFACIPVYAFWDANVPGFCLDRLAVWFANAAVNILTDICTAILPLPTLNALRIPKREKRILMIIFGLGGVTCLLSVLRLQSLFVISRSTDISWDNPLAATWSSLEVNVGIICSCIPTLKGLLAQVFPSLSFSHSYAESIGLRSGTDGTEGPVSFSRLGYHAHDGMEKAVMRAETHELSEQDDLSAPSPAARRFNDTRRVSGTMIGLSEKRASRLTLVEQAARAKVRLYVQSRPIDLKGAGYPSTEDSESTRSLGLHKQ